MTEKQKAAKQRNWKLLQLKGAIAFLRHLLPSSLFPQIQEIERAGEKEIDSKWLNEKLKIESDLKERLPF